MKRSNSIAMEKIKQYVSERYTRKEICEILFCMISLIAGIAFLSVTKYAAPAGDDRYNLPAHYYGISNTPIWESIISHYRDVLDSFMLKNQRFFPMLFPASYIRYWFKASTELYRMYIIIYTYVDIALISILASKALKNKSVGRAIFCSMPLLIGVWPLVDTNAMYSYEALVQATLFPMLIAGLCTIQWSKTKKKRYIIGAAIGAFYACATYELGFVLIIPIFGCVWIYESNLRQTIKRMLPAIAGEGFALLMNVLCRLVHSGESTQGLAYGVQFSFNPGEMLKTFWYQLKAAVPVLAMKSDGITYGEISTGDIVLSVVLAICFMLVVSRMVTITRKQNLLLFLVGLSLMTAPAALISLSVKFQDEHWVNSSYGYIPALIETFGLGIVIVSALVLIFRFLSRFKLQGLQVFLLMLGMIVLVPLGIYQRSAARDRYQATGIEWNWLGTSLANGLLDEYPDDATYLGYYEVWGESDDAQYYTIARNTHRKLDVQYYTNWKPDNYEQNGLYLFGTSMNEDNHVYTAWSGESTDATATTMKNVSIYVPQNNITDMTVVLYYELVDGKPVQKQCKVSELSVTYDENGGAFIKLNKLNIIPEDITIIG